MKRIVVGVDGSAVAHAALAWAAGLAQPCGAEVVVAVALDPTAERDDEELERWCAPAGGVTPRCVLGEQPAARMLLTAAEEEDADLLVVGHRGRGRARRLGSVALHIAHRAMRPFAVVPTTKAVVPKRFVVGLDGSPASARAAEWLTPVARALGADVVAACSPWPVPEVFGNFAKGPWEEMERRLDDEWARPLRERLGPIGSTLVEARDPATGLVTLADEEPATTIVMGTRRLGGLRPLRLGGVTMGVLHHTHVPVVVVPLVHSTGASGRGVVGTS
jgi:nucleotide-binding universal stress UspA family protein